VVAKRFALLRGARIGCPIDASGAAQRKSSLSRKPLPSPPPDRGRLYTAVVDQDGLCSVPLSNECFCRESEL
jgi:hypothetical protein